MALRFTDTDKWKDPWFRKLPPWGKLLWEHVRDTCDISGVWQVDTELCEMLIGMPIPWDQVGSQFGGRIRVLSADKWLVPKFVSFQFRGKFLPKSDRYAAAVVSQLQKHGLTESDLSFPTPLPEGGCEGPTRGCQPPQDKTIQDTPRLDLVKGGSKGGRPMVGPTGDPERYSLAQTLRGLGLRATGPFGDNAGSITEWMDLMKGQGRCLVLEEINRGIKWITAQAKVRGIEIQYAKHAKVLAEEWGLRMKRERKEAAAKQEGGPA